MARVSVSVQCTKLMVTIVWDSTDYAFFQMGEIADNLHARRHPAAAAESQTFMEENGMIRASIHLIRRTWHRLTLFPRLFEALPERRIIGGGR
jgi:hypothetical protein